MNKNPKYLRSIPLILFAAAFCMTGCKPRPQAQSGSEESPQAVRWGGPKNISMLPLIADAKGLFANHQIQSTFIDIQTGKKAMDALRTNDIDVGVLVDTNIAFAALEQAKDLQILACVMTKRDDALLIAKEGFQKPSDLRGQTIGVTLGTTSHAYLVQWLEANGMRPSDVKMQNMPPPAIQAALLNDSLRVGCLWQPFRYNVLAARSQGFVELKDPGVYTSYVLLVASKRFLESQPRVNTSQTAANFIRALIDAEQFVSANQDAARSLLAEKIGIPQDVMNSFWSEYDLRVFLDRELLTLLQKEGNWIIESVPEHKGKTVPDYRSFVNDDILRSVDATRIRGL